MVGRVMQILAYNAECKPRLDSTFINKHLHDCLIRQNLSLLKNTYAIILETAQVNSNALEHCSKCHATALEIHLSALECT